MSRRLRPPSQTGRVSRELGCVAGARGRCARSVRAWLPREPVPLPRASAPQVLRAVPGHPPGLGAVHPAVQPVLRGHGEPAAPRDRAGRVGAAPAAPAALAVPRTRMGPPRCGRPAGRGGQAPARTAWLCPACQAPSPRGRVPQTRGGRGPFAEAALSSSTWSRTPGTLCLPPGCSSAWWTTSCWSPLT